MRNFREFEAKMYAVGYRLRTVRSGFYVSVSDLRISL